MNAEVDYSLSYLKKPKYIMGLILFFVLMILWQFPLFEKIDNLIVSGIKQNRACPIDFERYNFNFIGVEFHKMVIPRSCTRSQAIKITKLNLGWSGFSFSPLGPSFSVEGTILGSPIEADLALGMSGFALVMQNPSENGKFEFPERKINLGQLQGLIPVSLNGDLYVSDLHVKSDYNMEKLDILTLNIASNNFSFPKQTIRLPGIPLPFDVEQSIFINNLLIMGQMQEDKPIFNLQQLTLGDDQSPLRTQFTGTVKINSQRMSSSIIDLKGELKLSEEFPQKDLINLVLARFDQRDGFYQIQLKGPLSSKNTFLNAKSPR